MPDTWFTADTHFLHAGVIPACRRPFSSIAEHDASLVEAWNARFLGDFGVAVDRPANGMLQDVHWSVGLFGYFPTYALGNVYAGCLNAALRDAVPDVDPALAQGDATPAVEWLRENLQRTAVARAVNMRVAQAILEVVVFRMQHRQRDACGESEHQRNARTFVDTRVHPTRVHGPG